MTNTPTPAKMTSKYLSPCRTFGLKRKSTSRTPVGLKLLKSGSPVGFSTPLKPKNENSEPVSTSERINETPTPRSRVSEPKKILKLSKRPDISYDVKGSNTRVSPLGCIVNSVQNINSENDKTEVKKDEPENNFSFEGFVSKEDLLDLIKTVNLKIGEVNRLKRTQIYSKKHDLNDLSQSTKKWKESFKKIVWAIHDELKLKGQDVSLDVILKEHNIPFDLVGFNEEVMDFD